MGSGGGGGPGPAGRSKGDSGVKFQRGYLLGAPSGNSMGKKGIGCNRYAPSGKSRGEGTVGKIKTGGLGHFVSIDCGSKKRVVSTFCPDGDIYGGTGGRNARTRVITVYSG